MKKIELKEIINPRSVTLSGRTNGENAREHFNLEVKDTDAEIYKIIIPNQIRTFNISYFLGMFSLSIDKLREERFREKYIFECENENLSKGIKSDIDEGIEWALEKGDILS